MISRLHIKGGGRAREKESNVVRVQGNGARTTEELKIATGRMKVTRERWPDRKPKGWGKKTRPEFLIDPSRCPVRTYTCKTTEEETHEMKAWVQTDGRLSKAYGLPILTSAR